MLQRALDIRERATDRDGPEASSFQTWPHKRMYVAQHTFVPMRPGRRRVFPYKGFFIQREPTRYKNKKVPAVPTDSVAFCAFEEILDIGRTCSLGGLRLTRVNEGVVHSSLLMVCIDDTRGVGASSRDVVVVAVVVSKRTLSEEFTVNIELLSVLVFIDGMDPSRARSPSGTGGRTSWRRSSFDPTSSPRYGGRKNTVFGGVQRNYASSLSFSFSRHRNDGVESRQISATHFFYCPEGDPGMAARQRGDVQLGRQLMFGQPGGKRGDLGDGVRVIRRGSR